MALTIGFAGNYLPASYEAGTYVSGEKSSLSYGQKKEKEAASFQASVDEFMKWSQMNPVERLRATYLKQHNLTEEKLAAMSPSERQKIEDEIKRFIEDKLKSETERKAVQGLTLLD